VSDGPVLHAALEWCRLGVGVVPVHDRSPKQLLPGIRWEEDGPLLTEEEIRSYWTARPDAQLAVTLDNSAHGGPRLACIDDDSAKHDAGDRERPRPLGGYRETTRSGGTHDVFRYATGLPPGIAARITGVGGFVDVLVGGILYVAPTANRGVGEYRTTTPLSAGFPEYPSVGLALDAASVWLKRAWLERAREGGGGSGVHAGRRGDFSECYRIAVHAVLTGATDEQVRAAVGCDHPEWSLENIHRTVERIRRWLVAHPREYPMLARDDLIEARRILEEAGATDPSPAEVADVAAEFHRTGGVPLMTGRDSTADELAAIRFVESGVPDDRSPAPRRVHSTQAEIAGAIYTRRDSVRSPGFITRRCGNMGEDGLACRRPLKIIPVASTDRNDPNSERWKLVQSLTGSAPFFAWPVRWRVYVAVSPLVEPMRRDVNRLEARELLRASLDEFDHAVVGPTERKLREAGFGGHTSVWASPDAVVAVVLTDAPPDVVLGDVTVGRSARGLFLDSTIDPVRDVPDATRWLEEVVERIMAHHRHVRGDWWDEVVDGLAISRFHNNRPWGYALLERIDEAEEVSPREDCASAPLIHPATPEVVRSAVLSDFYPYTPSPGTYLELVEDHARDVRERLRRMGRPVPYTPPATGPPEYVPG